MSTVYALAVGVWTEGVVGPGESARFVRNDGRDVTMSGERARSERKTALAGRHRNVEGLVRVNAEQSSILHAPTHETSWGASLDGPVTQL